MAEISTIARPYAVATFKIASSHNQLDEWSQMLKFATQVVCHVKFKAYMQSSRNSSADVANALLKVCGDNLNVQGQNLILLLAEYGRIALIPNICEAFEALKAQTLGILEAEIIVAYQPSMSIIDTLIKHLEKRFNKKIITHLTLDESLIGGMKIVIGDTVINASIQDQLQSLSYALAA